MVAGQLPVPAVSVLATLLSLTACVSLAGLVLCMVDDGPLARALERYEDRVERDRRYLRLEVTATRIVSAQVVACLSLVGAAVATASIVPLPLVATVLLGPGVWLGSRRTRRTGQIDAQLDGWLLLLANALKSNPALGDAFADSARMVAAPIGEELQLVLREHRLGASLGDALENMARRVDSRTVDAAFTALAVARRSGGDLTRTLGTAADSLREMARLEGVLRTKTAEGKAQAFVIGVVPAPLIGLLEWIDPTFLAPLFASFTGHLTLAAALTLWLIAIVWARRIVAVDL